MEELKLQSYKQQSQIELIRQRPSFILCATCQASCTPGHRAIAIYHVYIHMPVALAIGTTVVAINIQEKLQNLT